MKEGCQSPKFLEARNRLMKLLSCNHVLPFKISVTPKQGLGPGGQSPGCSDYDSRHRAGTVGSDGGATKATDSNPQRITPRP